MTPSKAISGTAFATLLLIAFMMGANHVAARIAFNHGVDVATAVVFRSAVTEDDIAHLAEPINVPAPLSVRQLALALADDYGDGRSVCLLRPGTPPTPVPRVKRMTLRQPFAAPCQTSPSKAACASLSTNTGDEVWRKSVQTKS